MSVIPIDGFLRSTGLESIEIIEYCQSIEISISIPGYDNKHVHVEIHDCSECISGNTMLIRAVRREYSYVIPASVDVDRISSSVKNGIFVIILPLKKKNVRTIEVT